jgi:VanZ like protein
VEKRANAQRTMSPAPQWSNRILILAFFGILFFTLLPFDFDLHIRLPGGRSPFLLGGWEKDTTALGEFLNVLLFIPFGFGISEALTERRRSRLATLTWALALGGLFSYSIEFLQIYVPPRDSGWGDIITNTSGSLAGFLLFDLYGVAILRALSGAELAFGKLLAWPRAAVIVPSYFLLCIAVSIPLQMQTRLDNWEPAPLLLVGNDASGQYRSAWEGEVFSLQVWNRPLDRAAVQELASGNDLRLFPSGLLAAYDFSAHPPLHDQMNFLPELSLDSNAERERFQPSATPANVSLDGRSWLTSSIPVPNLVRELQKTDQLAIRVVCRPGSTTRRAAAIVSLARESGIVDLELVQKHADLIFAFRNPISADRVFLDWRIRNVFTSLRTHDLVFSYDGNKASFYLDGRPASLPYQLGPGAALARHVRHLKTAELDGYNYIYYFLIFFVGGVLAGIAARNVDPGRRHGFRLFVFLMPALLLEAVLVAVSGRPGSETVIVLSVALTIAGSLWINADLKVRRQASP